MKKIDRKIEKYITEASYPLRFRNSASDISNLLKKMSGWEDDIDTIHRDSLITPEEAMAMKDKLERIYMDLSFLKKNFLEISKNTMKTSGKTPEKDRNWLIDYMERK